MEPRIQYTKTEDGISIAYSALGDGMPLVIAPSSEFSHIQAEWRLPGASSYYERLAEERMVVRYDGRGTGLSDRGVTDFTLDARMLDLDAVVARLGLKRFALLGSLGGGPVAIAYAASHPERVSHLLLWCSYPPSPDMGQGTPEFEVIRALIDKDWVIYTETVTRMYLGWSAGEEAQLAGAFLRESVTQETLKALVDAASKIDVTEFVPQVGAPTLVLCRREGIFSLEAARVLASGIPDARLAVMEGQSLIAWAGDSESVVKAIDEFLGEGEEAGTAAERPPADIVHTILFTDVEGSTALTDRLGDAKARDLLREHERIVREALKSHGGSEVKAMGDGFMTSFSSAIRALECAIAMQRAFAERNEKADEPIKVRIGLNAGEPISEEGPGGRGDLFGTAVNLAARVCSHAEAGQILAPIVVRELAAGKGFLFADIGETELRGFEDPVRLYELRWREGA
jgi:class 3 adenylate cyclase